MRVARSLRSGRHKSGSLRTALIRDERYEDIKSLRRGDSEVVEAVRNWEQRGGKMMFPNQQAAVGTVLGYSHEELTSIESQLWGKKSASLANQKARTKIQDSSYRKLSAGLRDAAINKIIFTASRSKDFF